MFTHTSIEADQQFEFAREGANIVAVSLEGEAKRIFFNMSKNRKKHVVFERDDGFEEEVDWQQQKPC